MKNMRGIVACILLVIVHVAAKPARPDSLPKTVWTYLDSADDSFVHSLCLSRVKNILQESRWVLEVLTPANIFIYLHEHEEYKSAIRNHKGLTFREEVEIIKLLILKQYGGLWMDPDTILLEPVDWIQHLKTLNGVQTYESTGFQMVLFSSVLNDSPDSNLLKGSEQQDGLELLPINLGIMLSLKASPVLEEWAKELMNELKKDFQEGLISSNRIQQFSLRALSKILRTDHGTIQDSLKQRNIWKLRYNDFNLNFAHLANSQNPYILADFYIKFPLDSISSQLSQPKYFISLSQVETQLDQILNPNISKLVYLNHNDDFSFFCPVHANCAHYIQQNSIVYSYLLKDTPFQSQIADLVNKDQRLYLECSNNSDNFWLKSAKISIQYTAYFLLLVIYLKVQKLCLQLLWVKLKIFAKPKYLILKSILKTVKSVIQYESDNGI